MGNSSSSNRSANNSSASNSFFAPPKNTVEVRQSDRFTAYVDQAGLDAEKAYLSQAHLSIEAITKDFDDCKKRTFEVNKGFAVAKTLSLSTEEQYVLTNLGKERPITGQTIIDSLAKQHKDFKGMLDMGCAWFATELQSIESAARDLPAILDRLVEKEALKEEAPQATNGMRP